MRSVVFLFLVSLAFIVCRFLLLDYRRDVGVFLRFV
jgi:hypothetical protein